jgi:hypothetical protein
LFPSAGHSLIGRLALIGALAVLAVLPSVSSSAMTPQSHHDRSAPQQATDMRSGSLRGSEIATTAAGVPATSSSFYVFGSFLDVCGLNANTECPLYDDAARETISPAGGMTILDFGAPCFEPVTLAWGIQLLNSQGCTPDAAIVILAQAWLRGFEANPNRAASSSYVLVLGTSNSLTAAVPGYALTAAEMALHGQAWFSSVVSPVTTIAQSLPSPVTTWAGDDIEESSDGNWYDGPTTAAWVDAFAAASGASKPCVASRNGLMVDYGDYVPNEPGWSPGAVYHVAWQAAPACPVPEIYQAANALEWQSLNRYARSNGLPELQFAGVLSQDGAAGSMFSSASWNSLKSATGQAPPYVSVIGVTGPIPSEVPDPPLAVTALPGPGLVTLGWSAPAWDGGAAVTEYTITVYAGSTVAQVLEVNGSPVPETAIVTGLTNGASYTFFVNANNRVGTGSQSLPSRSAVPSSLFPLR